MMRSAESAAPMIQLENVTFYRGTRAILRDINLSVEAGEMVAIVGPNGAGKSTLLSAIAGDVHPQSGTVSIGHMPIGEYRPRPLARIRSVLSQENIVTFPFTVREVVAMGRSPWVGLPESDEDETVIADSIDAVDMRYLSGRKFVQLSGGERARASLGRVLAQRTPIVLLDEPTAALDLKHQETALSIARELCAAGTTVVVVLHDLTLAAAYADRIAVINDGVMDAYGTPDEVLTGDLLSAVYDIPIEVFRHPASGGVIVQPRRQDRQS